MDKRKIEEYIFKGFMLAAVLIVLGSLIFILATILVKGLPTLSWEMITKTPRGGYYMGKGGGILNAILGSLLLGIGATILAAAIALPIVFYLNLYLRRKSRFALAVRFFLDVLWGIPSVVYGAFGFTLMIFFGLQASLLAGMITVAFLILPIMARGMDEVLKMIPFELQEASLSLGATRLQTAGKVIFRQAFPGILTAILMAFGRGNERRGGGVVHGGVHGFGPLFVVQAGGDIAIGHIFSVGHAVSGSPVARLRRGADLDGDCFLFEHSGQVGHQRHEQAYH